MQARKIHNNRSGVYCAVAFSVVVFPPKVPQLFGNKVATLILALCPDWFP